MPSRLLLFAGAFFEVEENRGRHLEIRSWQRALVGWFCSGNDACDVCWLGSSAEPFPMIENCQSGEEFGQFARFEQIVEIARAGSESALMDREGFVDQ